jgi:pantothenate kinase
MVETGQTESSSSENTINERISMDEITKILSTLMEQGRWVAKEFQEMKNDVKEIRKDIKDLQTFKWKILGFASCAAFIATMLVELIRR